MFELQFENKNHCSAKNWSNFFKESMNVDSCKCRDGFSLFSLEKSPRICSCPGLILVFDF